MSYAKVTCRYLGRRTGILAQYELLLRVADRTTDEELVDAATRDTDLRAAALGREYADAFRPLDETDGVFVEVQHV